MQVGGLVADARVAIVHDYLTQRGGAERVLLSMLRAFPDAEVHTSLYDPDGTYPEFARYDIRTGPLNRVALLRKNHRAALPLLAPAFSSTRIDADLVLCSSSGWAHGVRATGKKLVYCYSPARWLYQTERYLGGRSLLRLPLAAISGLLKKWDARAAASADRYVTLSTAVQGRITDSYHRHAEILPPPPTLDTHGPQTPIAGVEPGYMLCVSRLLPYKNVGAVVQAFQALDQRLIVVGRGPMEAELAAMASPNVTVLGRTDDAQLRWLYANSAGLIAASYEDYGLTPLEAASFGKPAAVLRWGGFLDTLHEGITGVYFDEPNAAQIADAVRELTARRWDEEKIIHHAEFFSEERFIARLRQVVAETLDER